MTMHWWNWLIVGFALGWIIRSTVHWLGWIGKEGVRTEAVKDNAPTGGLDSWDF